MDATVQMLPARCTTADGKLPGGSLRRLADAAWVPAGTGALSLWAPHGQTRRTGGHANLLQQRHGRRHVHSMCQTLPTGTAHSAPAAHLMCSLWLTALTCCMMLLTL